MFGYEPLPGSIPDRIIRHLQLQPEGTEVATAVLAELVGQPSSALSAILKPARDSGVLQARRLPNQGNNLFWSLGSVDRTLHDVGPSADPGPGPASDPDAQPDPRPAIEAQPPTACAPSKSRPARTKAKQTPPGPLDVPMRGFCCALFSDGRLVLEKPGQSMTLNPEQTRELVAYLERLGDAS